MSCHCEQHCHAGYRDSVIFCASLQNGTRTTEFLPVPLTSVASPPSQPNFVRGQIFLILMFSQISMFLDQKGIIFQHLVPTKITMFSYLTKRAVLGNNKFYLCYFKVINNHIYQSISDHQERKLTSHLENGPCC